MTFPKFKASESHVLFIWATASFLTLSSPAKMAISSPPTVFMAYGASATTEEIVAVRFEHADSKLSAKIVQREPIGIEGAPVVFHPQKRLIYVASLRPKEAKGNHLLAFSIDDDGRLSGKRDFSFKHGSAYLSLDRTGRYLLGASYFEGHVDVYQLDGNGFPKGVVTTVFENRDKAHSIRTSRDNRFVYVPYVKDQNAMFQYAFDKKTGKLRPLGPLQAKVPDGVGPRHIAYHPTKPFVFFSNEQHLGATSYRIGNNGQLNLIQVCDPGGLKPADGVAASDIEITRDGRFLFVGVRDFAKGKLDAVHRYEVADNGKLKHLGKTKADKIPWGLQLSPDGKHLLVTAAHGETLTAYKIGSDGNLDKGASIKWGKMIRDIAVVVLNEN